MKTKNFYLNLMVMAASGLITACSSTHHLAPVIDHTGASNPTLTSNSIPVAKTNNAKEIAKTVVSVDKVTEPGYYTVKKGDTLLHIALDYGVNYRDIVNWNNLSNPNDIKVDQVLRIAAPDAKSAAGSGVSTASAASAPAPAPAPLGSKEVKTFNVNMAPEIEVRSASSSAVSANSVPTNNIKVGPRGNKQPYSEAVMLELQKPDASIAPPSLTPKVDRADVVVSKVPAANGSASFTVNDDVLTWVWPAEGKILATFEEGKSKGIDIAGKAGQKVRAASAGKVMYAGSGIRGYGNLVILKHTNNLLSAYAHNKTIMVKEGQTIAKGQVIAEMGSSDSDAVKLHFEIRQQGKPVDPSKFLPSVVSSVSN